MARRGGAGLPVSLTTVETLCLLLNAKAQQAPGPPTLHVIHADHAHELSNPDDPSLNLHRFKESLRHGEGHQVMEGLWQYKGEWERDVRHGQGECRCGGSSS